MDSRGLFCCCCKGNESFSASRVLNQMLVVCTRGSSNILYENNLSNVLSFPHVPSVSWVVACFFILQAFTRGIGLSEGRAGSAVLARSRSHPRGGWEQWCHLCGFARARSGESLSTFRRFETEILRYFAQISYLLYSDRCRVHRICLGARIGYRISCGRKSRNGYISSNQRRLSPRCGRGLSLHIECRLLQSTLTICVRGSTYEPDNCVINVFEIFRR